jgi:predicted nucleic acid-binding protein
VSWTTAVDATPLFVDANIPIYAGGRAHELKEPCGQVLLMIARRPEAFLTDAEVLQELLHRYRGSDAWATGRARLEDFATLMRGRITPLRDDDVLRATALAGRYPGLSARDLVHLAVMLRLRVDTLVSTDRDFDQVAEVRRLGPADLPAWLNI